MYETPRERQSDGIQRVGSVKGGVWQFVSTLRVQTQAIRLR